MLYDDLRYGDLSGASEFTKPQELGMVLREEATTNVRCGTGNCKLCSCMKFVPKVNPPTPGMCECGHTDREHW